MVRGRTLNDWVQLLHRENCRHFNWTHRPLTAGAFGYDNLVHSVLTLADVGALDEQAQAALVHAAWARNYVHWRDNPPAAPYLPPHNALGDDRRNACAAADYSQLPVDEQEKDLHIVRTFAACVQQDAAEPLLGAK